MKIFIQGDVILKTCEKPTNITKLETDLLWKGENNHHRLRGKFKIGKVNDDLYVHSKVCELYHEEHNTIVLPEGFYKLSIVLEYDHLLEESRKVID